MRRTSFVLSIAVLVIIAGAVSLIIQQNASVTQSPSEANAEPAMSSIQHIAVHDGQLLAVARLFVPARTGLEETSSSYVVDFFTISRDGSEWFINPRPDAPEIARFQQIDNLTFNADGSLLAFSGRTLSTQQIEVWDLEAGERLNNNFWLGYHLVFDEDTLFTGGGSLQFYNLAAQEITTLADSGPIYDIALHGETLAAASDNEIRLWRLPERDPYAIYPVERWANDLSFSPDGRYLLAGMVATDEMGLQVIDLESGEMSSVSDEVGEIHAMALTLDGEWLLTLRDPDDLDAVRDVVSVWRMREDMRLDYENDLPVVQELDHETGVILGAAFLDERHVITANRNGKLTIWDFREKVIVAQYEPY